MVHEAMVLEYSGRHLALIELAAALKLLLYMSLHRLHLCAVWHRGGADGPLGIAVGLAAYLGKLAVRGLLLAIFETSVAKMRVFRVSEFLGGALMLGLLGVSCSSCRGPSDGNRLLRRRASSRRRHGRRQLHAALPGPHVRHAERLRAARRRAGALGRLAGLCAGRAAPLCDGGARAGLQGDRHPDGAASHRGAPANSPRGRERRRHRHDHAGRDRPHRAVDQRHAAGDRRRRCLRARGPRLRTLGRAARSADDDHAAQCGEPGRRLHVAGERPRPRRDGGARHAAGGRDQHRLLGADRLHRLRDLPVPHPRALRHRRCPRAGPFRGDRS